ncbi:PREDICTED: uncharacterized protein LOC108359241 [Rhagoletis zephyria]|uniref:uncharacterized protein LOC108359241 n=1 Tax=Rhagoletis zephyria TaxID=28612 RepID=UPI00081125EF|nr:PREDICTED: uncharacterized protein LOC108359241 [Rhagoletis zephyria]XP_036320443.1 uncharacterized protein LOC118734955 [Rhagoletis pomonella]
MFRVKFGVAAASHLAIKALQQTAKEAVGRYDKAASVILRDFYVDDLLTGSSNIEELQVIQCDVSTVLGSGGFELRQWASNCPELTASIPNASKEISKYIAEDKKVHALGLIWNTKRDYLTFAVNLNEPIPLLSKRAYLSDSSVLFDPIVLLSPCTIKSKIWFQDLWRSNVDWDDPVPMPIAREWCHHREQLKLFSDLKLKRWTGIGAKGAYTQLHLFADASERAYAAVIYARTIQPCGEITVALASSKTKVAPLKVTTLPRLELCAANLAAKLAKTIMDSLPNQTYPMFAWPDPTITLAWLKAHQSRWTTFITNRVADTQEIVPAESWNHIRSEINPADCASRGLTPLELMEHRLWWNGPEFLSSS